MLTLDSTLDSLRARGMRITPQRVAVVEELVGNTSHPTADVIAQRVIKRMPGVSLSTIYKTLGELADLGLVQRVSVDESVRFDPDTSVHGHMLCTECRSVVDVWLPELIDEYIKEIEMNNNVQVKSVALDFEGACSRCLAHNTHE